jgi:hypothetical protein
VKPSDLKQILDAGSPDVILDTGACPNIIWVRKSRVSHEGIRFPDAETARKIALCVNLAPLLSELWKQVEDYETYVRFDFGGKWAPIREALAALAAFEVEHG